MYENARKREVSKYNRNGGEKGMLWGGGRIKIILLEGSQSQHFGKNYTVTF
jgi:hypothetical protein